MPLSRFRGQERPFRANDVWRGTLTSCHQNQYHLRRNYRYFPVDLSIDHVDLATGAITATFVTHLDHSFYELKGTYEEDTRRLFLEAVRGKLAKSWEPCDAEAWVSPDFSTLSGVSLCEAHGKCDAGGGEFTLRQDKTQFIVEGAGDLSVHGMYVSKGSFESGDAARPDAINAHRVYDGAPVYMQSCDRRDDDCEDKFAIVHVVVGQYGYWHIQRASTIDGPSGAADIRYSVCSEDVYPPSVGWRPIDPASAPPPLVRPVVSSMYELQTYDRINSKAADADRTLSIGLLLAIGSLLWLLLALVLRARVKLRRTPAQQPPTALLANNNKDSSV
ncbi:hypothetical protein CTAYLR_010144 [Chrysophaeum taylorii]|uniref:Uncharacterized protein n=1 Tax=Chrysophaeum taylorii TaxID=2483200 RepID=A0AAD7UGR7_9STRA|nr:hypothetical protein CTAYLR_010144 [Chrysophaeum taylorii]